MRPAAPARGLQRPYICEAGPLADEWRFSRQRLRGVCHGGGCSGAHGEQGPVRSSAQPCVAQAPLHFKFPMYLRVPTFPCGRGIESGNQPACFALACKASMLARADLTAPHSDCQTSQSSPSTPASNRTFQSLVRCVGRLPRRRGLQLGGNTLLLEYAYCVPPLPAGPNAAALPAANNLDWICDMCSAVNFARWVPLLDE
jgi:hypothetical protein